MNNAHKKECIHCANYNVTDGYCAIDGKCDFVKLTTRKIDSIGNKEEFTRIFFGNKVDDDWWHRI